jgi:hypothetical protein
MTARTIVSASSRWVRSHVPLFDLSTGTVVPPVKIFNGEVRDATLYDYSETQAYVESTREELPVPAHIEYLRELGI